MKRDKSGDVKCIEFDIVYDYVVLCFFKIFFIYKIVVFVFVFLVLVIKVYFILYYFKYLKGYDL